MTKQTNLEELRLELRSKDLRETRHGRGDGCEDVGGDVGEEPGR